MTFQGVRPPKKLIWEIIVTLITTKKIHISITWRSTHHSSVHDQREEKNHKIGVKNYFFTDYQRDRCNSPDAILPPRYKSPQPDDLIPASPRYSPDQPVRYSEDNDFQYSPRLYLPRLRQKTENKRFDYFPQFAQLKNDYQNDSYLKKEEL